MSHNAEWIRLASIATVQHVAKDMFAAIAPEPVDGDVLAPQKLQFAESVFF